MEGQPAAFVQSQPAARARCWASLTWECSVLSPCPCHDLFLTHHCAFSSSLSPVTAGAPHAVDEAAAIWFGTACPAGNIADVATKRANTFGTLVASAATGDCDA